MNSECHLIDNLIVALPNWWFPGICVFLGSKYDVLWHQRGLQEDRDYYWINLRHYKPRRWAPPMKLACCRPLTIVVFWLCLQQVDWEDLREEGRRGPARSPESKPDAFICAWKISELSNEISSNVCGDESIGRASGPRNSLIKRFGILKRPVSWSTLRSLIRLLLYALWTLLASQRHTNNVMEAHNHQFGNATINCQSCDTQNSL